MPKWVTIGVAHYRMSLSSVGFIRPFFLPLVVALLALYVVYLAPSIVEFFIDEALVFLFSRAAVAMIQIILFSLFIWFFFFPVSLALRDIQATQIELFLSAPVKASHLLLGEFLGAVPFYAIAIVLLAGVFTAILQPLGIGLLQTTITVLIFVLTFLAALWIGVVVAAILRTRLGRTGRGQDIGKALGFILALPVVGIMYAMMGGGVLDALQNPGTNSMVTGILGIFPSSWGARLVTEFASNPANIQAIWAETVTRFGGLVVFMIASVWIGLRIADRAYSLEVTSFSGATVGRKGLIYRTIRSLGGRGSFGTLLISITKDYTRRMQNLSRIGYIIGILVLINLFLVRPEEPASAMVTAQALFGLLAAFVVGEVTVRGKEVLFIYRKSPHGETGLIKARLVQGWAISVPIAATITVIQLSLIPGLKITEILFFTGFISATVVAYVIFTLGLFLMIPAFSDKGGEFMATAMIIVMFATGGFIGTMIAFGRFWGMLTMLGLSWAVGIVLLALGRVNLGRIE
jgi:hypothetical protein